MLATSFSVPVRLPFNLRLTVGALRRLPNNPLYVWADDTLWLALPLLGQYRPLAAQHTTGADALLCRSLDGSLTAPEIEAATAMFDRLLGLQVDTEPALARAATDPLLADLAAQLAGMKPPRFLSLWESFLQIIPYQQVSLMAAMSIVRKVVAAVGDEVAWEGGAVGVAPSPRAFLAASDEVLRGCGLSVAKIRTLRGLAERIESGELDEEELSALPDEEIIERLVRLPGIGRWTAQITLLRGFGRLAAFPVGDSGAARGLLALTAQTADPAAEAIALPERMGDWRGYLYLMLLGRRILAQES